MPELTDLDLFLKPEDVVGEIQVTFQDTGRRVSKDETGFEKDSFEITIKLPNGQNRVWTMNVTSQRMVARKLGTNTDTWVGKNVSLIKTEQNVRGKMKEVIYVKGESAESPQEIQAPKPQAQPQPAIQPLPDILPIQKPVAK